MNICIFDTTECTSSLKQRQPQFLLLTFSFFALGVIISVVVVNGLIERMFWAEVQARSVTIILCIIFQILYIIIINEVRRSRFTADGESITNNSSAHNLEIL